MPSDDDDKPWYVIFPDGAYVTRERDFYGIDSRAFSPDEIYECRGRTPLGYSCKMNAQNVAWFVGRGARPVQR